MHFIQFVSELLAFKLCRDDRSVMMGLILTCYTFIKAIHLRYQYLKRKLVLKRWCRLG